MVLFQIEGIVVGRLLTHVEIHCCVVTVLEARPAFAPRQFDLCIGLPRLRAGASG
jgi:hypothetical protein